MDTFQAPQAPIVLADDGTHLAAPVGQIEGPFRPLLLAWAIMAQAVPFSSRREVPCDCDGTPHSKWEIIPEEVTLSGVLEEIERINMEVGMGGFPHRVEAEIEGAFCPDLILKWFGVFTPGREAILVVPIDPEAPPGEGSAVLKWNSGTGSPSWYIGQALQEAGIIPNPPCEQSPASKPEPLYDSYAAAAAAAGYSLDDEDDE